MCVPYQRRVAGEGDDGDFGGSVAGGEFCGTLAPEGWPEGGAVYVVDGILPCAVGGLPGDRSVIA